MKFFENLSRIDSFNTTLALNNTLPANSQNAHLVIYQIVATLLFLLGCPANFIIVYLVNKVPRLQTPTNYFVSSLAIADFLVLFWMLATVLEISIGWLPQHETLTRYLYPSFDMFLASASLVNVCIVSCDRYVACLYPLRYFSIMTGRTRTIITASWCYSIMILILALTRIFWQNKEYELFVFWLCVTLSFFIPAFLVIYSYVAIGICAVKGTVIEEKPSNSHLTDHLNGNNDEELNPQKSSKLALYKFQLIAELKVTGMILIIVAPFTLGWSFYVGTQLYEFVVDKYISDPTFNVIFTITPWFISAINANFYFITNRPIRESFFNEINRFRFEYAHKIESRRIRNKKAKSDKYILKESSAEVAV